MPILFLARWHIMGQVYIKHIHVKSCLFIFMFYDHFNIIFQTHRSLVWHLYLLCLSQITEVNSVIWLRPVFKLTYNIYLLSHGNNILNLHLNCPHHILVYHPHHCHLPCYHMSVGSEYFNPLLIHSQTGIS